MGDITRHVLCAVAKVLSKLVVTDRRAQRRFFGPAQGASTGLAVEPLLTPGKAPRTASR